jgi:DNA-binding response OmpR family regulator
MHILIADDDAVLRHALTVRLREWGYDIIACADGAEVRTKLDTEPAPLIAILDWDMPGIDGPTLCAYIRNTRKLTSVYVILLTAHDTKTAVVEGLDSGADDYVTKPFDWDELRARIRIGVRIGGLQHALAQRVVELQAALKNVRHLTGLLPICAYCKRIRDDRDYWQQVETYVSEHTDAQFTHGICPDCFTTVTAEIDLEDQGEI